MPGEWTGAAFAPHDHVGASLIEVARQPARKRRSTATLRRATASARSRRDSAATGVVKALRGLPEVHALHTTNGRWDIVVELGVDSLEAFGQLTQVLRSLRLATPGGKSARRSTGLFSAPSVVPKLSAVELEQVIKRGCGEQNLVPRAAQASQPKPVEPEGAFHVRKSHLDLFALAA